MRSKKSNDKNFASIQQLHAVSTTMLQYMQKLTDAIEKLDLEMKSTNKRLTIIEKNAFELKSSKATKPSIELPELPKIKAPSKNKTKSYSQSGMPPDELQYELKSVLHKDSGLTSVEEGKKEQYREYRVAVHEEYKQLGLKNPVAISNDSPQLSSESELKNQLARDLDEAFELIKKKLKE